MKVAYKRIVASLLTLFLLFSLASCMESEKKGTEPGHPFKDLTASDIASASVTLLPPDKTVQIENIEELIELVNAVEIYEEDESWKEYTGQACIFTLVKKDGTKLEINAYNPFIIINGVGYKCKYEPCEALNAYANALQQTVQKDVDGEYYIVLPASQEKVEISEGYSDYIPLISDDLVAAAETKITAEIAKYTNNSGFYLTTDEEGYLCLVVEVIKNLPEEERNESVGCVDHEHLFFPERITFKPIELAETETNTPDNFSFSLTWNTYGISSYDSTTKKLVKTTDTTNPEDYATECTLSSKDLEEIYMLLRKLDVNSYPDTYDPHPYGLGSDPSMTLILTFREGDTMKTIRAEEIAITYESKDEEGQRFLDTCKSIIEILTATEEWQALPEYEFYYD